MRMCDVAVPGGGALRPAAVSGTPAIVIGNGVRVRFSVLVAQEWGEVVCTRALVYAVCRATYLV